MADKKTIIVLAPQAEISGSSGAIGKMLKKGALLPNYTAGDVLEKAVADADVARMDAAGVAKGVEEGQALMLVDLGGADTAALEQAMGVILDAVDRRTMLAVAGKSALAFYGAGVNTKVGSIDRPASAKDVLPTLASVGEFALTDQCSGAVIYQALKSPNTKLEEIGKLKEALQRMEGALARDNREPWDKHDCA